MTAEWLDWRTSFAELAANRQVSGGMLGRVGDVEDWKDSSLRVSGRTDPWGASQRGGCGEQTAAGDQRRREVPPFPCTALTKAYPAYF